jgi:phospholipid/cholesterol/gamma-HCH transport system ATP-binding protein
VIRLEGVRKSFVGSGDARNALPVVDEVGFTVPTGCLYGLIGPGAAGKSVLLKLVTGLLRADAGKIWVGEREISAASEIDLQIMRREIGMLFQNNALFDNLTVFENVAFPLRRLYNLTEEEIRERVYERMKRVSLPGFEERLPGGLSGGQKKRVGVARATITRAPIVLYDEPAAGLDPVTSQKIFELLRQEQEEAKATVIMVSSDLDRLLPVTDRIGMMYRGRLMFDGTTDEARAADEPHVRQFVHGLTEGPL